MNGSALVAISNGDLCEGASSELCMPRCAGKALQLQQQAAIHVHDTQGDVNGVFE